MLELEEKAEEQKPLLQEYLRPSLDHMCRHHNRYRVIINTQKRTGGNMGGAERKRKERAGQHKKER